jgi:hypothetical protein
VLAAIETNAATDWIAGTGVSGVTMELPMTATPAEKMTGVGLAGALVLSALLDTLYSKGALTADESRNVLDAALTSLGQFVETPEGFEAAKIIGHMRGRFR